ncbi:MAG: 3-deoxy-manno-octulosonate cytidylyltransferase [Flavobacteriaceae bacterium]|nr:3-deoxy-manno-octulosonate cytidylyltransferase [Flavobacteriaceae bacterium]
MKITALIPARLNSSRFNGKLMMDLCGKPVITRTYNAVLSSNLFSSVIVVTQDNEIYEEITSNNGNSILIEKDYNSGTDRIADACVKLEADIIVNIQGDEPFINQSSLEKLVNIFKNDSRNEINYASLMKLMNNEKDINNPNNVKVAVDNNGFAVNFSRKPISSITALSEEVFYKHIGVYGYRKDSLISFTKLSPTKLEMIEKIEALRIIESGFKIKMAETLSEFIGIDTKEDLSRAIEIWDNK